MKPIIHTGMDFNAANCNAVSGIYENKILRIFKEFTHYFDTPDLAKGVKEEFDGFVIYAYPDASGSKRTSTNAHVSDIAILKENKFRIKAKSVNPLIRDRVASVNRAFEKGRLVIDTEACPELTECLEQQVYLSNGMPDKKSGYDHLVEALGYMVYYLMPVRRNTVVQTAAAG